MIPGRRPVRAAVLLALLTTFLYYLPETAVAAESLLQESVHPLSTRYKEDFNGDGKIGVPDAVALLLLGRDSPEDPVADYNGDGRYSITDVIRLLLNIRDGILTPVSEPEPDPLRYVITGQVFCLRFALPNVIVLLQGDRQESTVTDGNGYYIFEVPAGTYTIIPAEVAGYGFNPVSRDVEVRAWDLVSLDFFVFGIESLPED